MLFDAKQGRTAAEPQAVTLRCHQCRRYAIFQCVELNDLVLPAGTGQQRISMALGHRLCPNPDCRAHVFVAYDWSMPRTILASYPPQRFDFDPAGIPPSLLKPLHEAISCHAHGCYESAAMMIRKTMEHLCAHHDAKGKDLKERLETLRNLLILPIELRRARSSSGGRLAPARSRRGRPAARSRS